MTPEPEWDDSARAEFEAWHKYKTETLCPQCKGPRSECEKPETDFYPFRHVCWRSAAQRVANRLWHKRHEKANPDAVGYLPTDGVAVAVATSDIDPEFELTPEGGADLWQHVANASSSN